MTVMLFRREWQYLCNWVKGIGVKKKRMDGIKEQKK